MLSLFTAANQVRSIDYFSDVLANGRKVRTFNVIAGYNREGLAIDVDLLLTGDRVIRGREQVIEGRGKPGAIGGDNSPEVNVPLLAWANKNQISMLYIQTGKPKQNAYI